MTIRKPVYKNTEKTERIYADYGAVSPLSHLKSAYESDKCSKEYRFDKVLARYGAANGDPNRGGNDDGDALMTRGRSLYMFTHDVSVIGFGGDPSYCQPLGRRELMSIELYSGTDRLEVTEVPSERVNMPSSWHGTYVSVACRVSLDKFITEENVAVALYEITNTTDAPLTLTVAVSSPFAREPWTCYPDNKKRAELRDRLRDRNDLTTLAVRMCAPGGFRHPSRHRGDGEPMPWEKRPCLFAEITVGAGETYSGDAIIAFTSVEIPEAERDYIRFSALADASHAEALDTQKREYNEYWHLTVPYIDVPSVAMKKAIDYHFWLLRYNTLDANIPGHDYQYPTTMEGVLGYNNAIVLTQCMHLQDTKWNRTPYLPYGQLLSVGSCSGGSAFLDNPGNRRCWNNHYGQYIGTAGREAFYVHGGSKELALTLARWFEGDAKGQLEHYGQHESASTPKSHLIAYRSNYMTGNDADTCSMHYRGVGMQKMHAENAYVFGAAHSSAELYRLAGETEKAAEMDCFAEAIRGDILEYLWCDKCKFFETRAVLPREDFIVHNPDKPNLVPYKENNNYNYFSERVAPTDERSLEKYLPAFRHLADPEEFPIFPYYTASQRDNKLAPGSNNFSNINFTVQARAFSAALRQYDKGHVYVTPEMFENLIDWCAWNMYPDGGDISYPNNNEFFNADRANDPSGEGDYYRSWIYHNILGNYNYLFIEEMAGVRPRADGKIELSPIDFGYKHFAVDNIRYHGADVSVFCNLDGHYPDIPEGYSLFVNGKCVLTLAGLADAIYDPESGKVETDATVITAVPCGRLPSALECETTDEKTLRLYSLAGIDRRENLALGATVTASYTPKTAREAMWAEKHRADGYDESSKAVNEYAPTPEAVVDGKSECMPFWGNFGSTNEYDTLTLTFPEPRTFDTLVAHFYDDRQKVGYSYPRRYLIEYLSNGEWHPVTTRSQSPRFMCANRNESRFDAVTTDALRVHFYSRIGHFTAVTEIALYSEGTPRVPVINYAPEVYAHSNDLGGLKARLAVEIRDDGMPFDKDLSCHWTVGHRPDGASVSIEDENSPETVMTVSAPGWYHVTLHVTDGEIRRHCAHAVLIEKSDAELYDVAPEAAVKVDFCSDWENANGVTNASFEPRSSNVGAGRGWGTYGAHSDEHFLSLEWDAPRAISSLDIYWYCDNGGIKLPSAFSLSYEDAGGREHSIPLSSETVEKAINVDSYNRISFATVKAKKLTLHVSASKSSAIGIYRIKAYMPEIEMLEDVIASVKSCSAPALPDTVTGITAEGDRIPLSVVWFTSALDTSADGLYEVSGVTSPLTYQVKASVYARGDMDAAGVTEVDPVAVTCRSGEAPQLPEFAVVHRNNGSADSLTHRIVWNEAATAVRDASGEYTVADAGTIDGLDLHIALTVRVI